MTVGIVGLGNMGGPICRNLIKSGEDVSFFDLDERALAACAEVGGRAAASVAELAAASDVIFTSLPTTAAMEAVALGPDGIEGNARPGTVYFDLTTNSPALIRRASEALAAKGITLLDAPVSGGPAGAEAATLSVMVGGDEKVFKEHLPLLKKFAANPMYLGGLCSGAIAKLVNNLMAICNMTVAAEGLMLGAAAGIDPRTLDALIRKSSGTSMGYTALADHALSGDYTPTMALDVCYKDIKLALELADEVKVPTPHAAATANLMRMALGMGYAKDDPTVVFRVYESTLGREVRG